MRAGAAHRHDDLVPPAALKAAAALVITVLALVALVRADLLPGVPTAAALRAEAGTAPARERLLLFADQADGTVRVADAASGAPVAIIGRENSGFVRGVMRGLARERRLHGLGSAAPFRLTLWRDGALSLADPATGRVIELGSFGPDNRGAFERLLDGGQG
jgi:putative photosynthetic complex assembly protein